MIKYVSFKDNNFSTYLEKIPLHKKALFIDRNPLSHFDQTIFQTDGLSADIFTLSCGEGIKTRSVKDQLEDQLFEKGYTKDSVLLAVGGGTLSDLIGYLASTFCRGVSLIFIPTTLVAMIDACIGGKNGVNTGFGKNLVGTIYSPSEIWIDPIFLSTLPFDQIQEGIIEMIKHGLIFDSKHFEEVICLEQIPSLQLIQRSIQIKQSFVNSDINDYKSRQILNFGHTFAHAIETLSNYQISHGKAVLAGILIESYISYIENFLSKEHFQTIYHSLKPLIEHISYPRFSLGSWERVLFFDKKNRWGKIYVVRLEKIGKATLPMPVIRSTWASAVRWFENASLCSR